jgi:hypothetical protein
MERALRAAPVAARSATVAGIGASNLIASVPTVVGVYLFDWPCLNGLVYAPGAGQVASISYS